jgi:hypothetical protein
VAFSGGLEAGATAGSPPNLGALGVLAKAAE